jgi:hypothetical protein
MIPSHIATAIASIFRVLIRFPPDRAFTAGDAVSAKTQSKSNTPPQSSEIQARSKASSFLARGQMPPAAKPTFVCSEKKRPTIVRPKPPPRRSHRQRFRVEAHLPLTLPPPYSSTRCHVRKSLTRIFGPNLMLRIAAAASNAIAHIPAHVLTVCA